LSTPHQQRSRPSILATPSLDDDDMAPDDTDELPPPDVPLLRRAFTANSNPRERSAAAAAAASSATLTASDAELDAASLDARADHLRDWLTSYQQWKHWQASESKVPTAGAQSQQHHHSSSQAGASSSAAAGVSSRPWADATVISPLVAVKAFLRANLRVADVISVARLHHNRGEYRRWGLRMLRELYEAVSLESARMLLLGLLPAALKVHSGAGAAVEQGSIASGSAIASGEGLPSVLAGITCCDAFGKGRVLKEYGLFAAQLTQRVRSYLDWQKKRVVVFSGGFASLLNEVGNSLLFALPAPSSVTDEPDDKAALPLVASSVQKLPTPDPSVVHALCLKDLFGVRVPVTPATRQQELAAL